MTIGSVEFGKIGRSDIYPGLKGVKKELCLTVQHIRCSPVTRRRKGAKRETVTDWEMRRIEYG